MIKISAVIITFNEEKNIERCMLSLKGLVDEIILIDSNSTDNTVKIAEKLGAKVILKPFTDYISQKNFADAQASNDWILSLDADEAVSEELLKSIESVKANPAFHAYHFNRLTNYCGTWIRHSGWYPDAKIRLFNRTKGKWRGEKIHEKWMLDHEGEVSGKLKGDLLHYSYHTLSDHIRQIEKFTEIMAQRAVNNGQKTSRIKIFFAPKWKFFQSYFLQLGLLDGYAGYMVCKLSAWATFIKYAKIYQYSRKK